MFFSLSVLNLEDHLGLVISPQSPLSAGYITLRACRRSLPLRFSNVTPGGIVGLPVMSYRFNIPDRLVVHLSVHARPELRAHCRLCPSPKNGLLTHLHHWFRFFHPLLGINVRQLFSAYPVGQKDKISHYSEELLRDVHYRQTSFLLTSGCSEIVATHTLRNVPISSAGGDDVSMVLNSFKGMGLLK